MSKKTQSTMELKDPKKKKRVKSELKSSLPLVFGRKGDVTKFHASLTALGSCVADPTEMEIIYKMGYFGKGSLSKSHPSFGRVNYGAPPIIRKRQWKRRQKWIGEVQKLSIESFYNDQKNDSEEIKNNGEKSMIEHEYSPTVIDVSENLNASCNSEIILEAESSLLQENKQNDIEILEGELKDPPPIPIASSSNGTKSNIVDEVILDSAEEEISEIPEESFTTANYFDKDDEYYFDDDYSRVTDLQGKALVLPDSDSDTENYLIHIKPELKHENFPVRETLHLTFEETFFLTYGLGCLRIIDFDGKFLSISETWEYFCKEQKNFLQKYVVYHYFRSKGWVVKPGLKYGGDFLLYKEGPPFYHASYIVIVDVLDAVSLKRIENKVSRSMTWNDFIGLERLAETVGKEVLFAQVLWPLAIPIDSSPASPDALSQFTVREVLWKRWKLNQDTSTQSIEGDYDEDEMSS